MISYCASDVTVVVTSYGRIDLLEKMLASFQEFNSYPVEGFIVIEDDPSARSPANLPDRTLYLHNRERQGQIRSIDRAYQEVRTPLIFHCEDDWEFSRSSFIQASKEILASFPDILLVKLTERHDPTHDMYEHPIVKLPQYPFEVLAHGYDQVWHGFTFTPGLRRMADYQRIGSYAQHTGEKSGIEAEAALSELYRQLGYYVAILPEGYVHNTGEERSTYAHA